MNSIEESGAEPAQQINNQVNDVAIWIDDMADSTIHGNENSPVDAQSDLYSIADAEPAQRMNNQVNCVVIMIDVIRLILIAIYSDFVIQNNEQKTVTWKDSIKNIFPFWTQQRGKLLNDLYRIHFEQIKSKLFVRRTQVTAWMLILLTTCNKVQWLSLELTTRKR